MRRVLRCNEVLHSDRCGHTQVAAPLGLPILSWWLESIVLSFISKPVRHGLTRRANDVDDGVRELVE